MLDHLKQFFVWLISGGGFQRFYADELRSDFFSGFLSLAAFMLAAKTFIVMHMKQEVYDGEEYDKRFRSRKELVGERDATKYGPLRRMSDALYWIVISSLAAAMSQMTLGLCPLNITTLICIALVVFAAWKLVKGLQLIKANLDSWFEILEEDSTEDDNEPSA